MFQRDKSGRILRDGESGQPIVKTSHTLNPVPLSIHDRAGSDHYVIDPDVDDPGIANVTATCLELLGYRPPAELARSLLRFK
jgi:2,3-bisphosphoglycerate-independent phosphoglycerate mutase